MTKNNNKLDFSIIPAKQISYIWVCHTEQGFVDFCDIDDIKLD
jgi:hypothetical protein